MNSFPEYNFNIVKADKNSIHKKVKKTFLPLDWMKNHNEWNRGKFISDIVNFIELTQTENTFPNMVLLEMLGSQVDVYIQCMKKIEEFGLVESFNKGATTGASVYFTIADKALNRALQIMKELGITPSHRIGVVNLKSSEAFEIEEFLATSF
jgi:phage terminase small subunit